MARTPSPRSKSYAQPCPIACALDLLGDRWTLLIVRELLRGPRRFGEIAQALPGIPSNVLSERLRRLEASRLLVRQLLDERPPRASYQLTAAGQQLWIPLRAIGLWSMKHVQRRIRRVHRACGARVEAQVVCPDCGRAVEDDECEMKPARSSRS